ncbi:hypothetical protein PIB30_052606 [Stylosanthes scabra]|uniref:TPX2 C-terminal domain-containing protein n=1 Tax=Stylosanthes scabra TaxID=79078 RepID=A0ABU6RIX9_9FABA|nr:hypothetical protein [Stylosanthes scabra]
MESENGVAVEEEKHVIGVTTKENMDKEVEDNSINGENHGKNNEESKPKVEGEASNSASDGVEVEADSKSSAASKSTKIAKESGGKSGGVVKNNKAITKDKPNLKASSSSSQKQRQNLSKSLTFPSRSATARDGMKKSIDGVQPGRSNPATPANDVTKNQTSQPSQTSVVNQNPDSKKAEKANKEDEDSQSTTSSTIPRRRSSGSGFSFRLEERAEKRKEFFSKLEEKIQVKEAEKTNLQEKSKENQEAEIKQLRKAMTFKIPTTRSISPKLGRNKGFVVSNNSEDKSCSQNDSTTKAKETSSKKTEKDSRKSAIKVSEEEQVNNSEYQRGGTELGSENSHGQNNNAMVVSYEVIVGG